MKDTSAVTALPRQASGFVEKQRPTGPSIGHKLPNWGERSRMFRLAAHHSSWDLVETTKGWRLVPTLKRLILQPGVNWTRAPEREGMPLDASDLEAKARSRFGQSVFVDIDKYMYTSPGEHGTVGHFLLWENVRAYPDGEWEVEFDQDGYDQWRWSLVESGAIEPPRAVIISQHRSRLKRTADRATRTPHLAQAQAAKADAERRIAGLAEALEALEQLGKSKAAPPGGGGTSPRAQTKGS